MDDHQNNIPWARIQACLDRVGGTQTWLAAQLNVATNVVTNWKRRDGAPAARSRELARIFGVPVEALLGDARAPSDYGRAAHRIIARVGDLDRRGLLSDLAVQAIEATLNVVESAAGAAPKRKR